MSCGLSSRRFAKADRPARATGISPLTGLIRIGTGRDAADVAFATMFGSVRSGMPLVSFVAEEDQAQMSHDEFVSLHLNSLDYGQLRLIEEALDRIHSGDYGVCLACEEPIPAKRLQALPWARYCVTCQEEAGASQDRHILEDRPRLNFA